MLTLDPSCGADVSDTHPIAADVLRGKANAIEPRTEGAHAPTRPGFSPKFKTRLTRWGVLVETSP